MIDPHVVDDLAVVGECARRQEGDLATQLRQLANGGGDGRGQNKLGQILMEVRRALRAAETQLAAYREELERTEGGPRKLHTHAVVGIGLERLVG